jgi:hypothetical protein
MSIIAKKASTITIPSNLMEATIFNNSFLYNTEAENIGNNELLDNISEPDLFNNFLIYEFDLKNNYNLVTLDLSYDFRPDKLAQEIYGNSNYYPAILICNDFCSILQFRVKNLNYEAKIPQLDLIKSIIEKL